MENISDSELEKFNDYNPFIAESDSLELEELRGEMPSSEEFKKPEVLNEDYLEEQLEQLDGLISSIAEASTDLDELNNLLGSSGQKKLANAED